MTNQLSPATDTTPPSLTNEKHPPNHPNTEHMRKLFTLPSRLNDPPLPMMLSLMEALHQPPLGGQQLSRQLLQASVECAQRAKEPPPPPTPRLCYQRLLSAALMNGPYCYTHRVAQTHLTVMDSNSWRDLGMLSRTLCDISVLFFFPIRV